MAKVKEQEIIVEEDRKNICVLVIDAILEEEPSRLIESAAFQCLANELCEIFPGTSPVSYFRTFLPKTPLEKQRNLSGPLYKAYIKKREKYRKSGVLPPSARSRSSSRSTTSTSVKDCSLKRIEAPAPTSCEYIQFMTSVLPDYSYWLNNLELSEFFKFIILSFFSDAEETRKAFWKVTSTPGARWRTFGEIRRQSERVFLPIREYSTISRDS